MIGDIALCRGLSFRWDDTLVSWLSVVTKDPLTLIVRGGVLTLASCLNSQSGPHTISHLIISPVTILPHLLSLTLNDRLWKANWHLLLRCWPAAPSTTTVIIIIWPCWSSMNVWTSWSCTVIISTLHSQKRTGHPSFWVPGFLGSFS